MVSVLPYTPQNLESLKLEGILSFLSFTQQISIDLLSASLAQTFSWRLGLKQQN